MRMPLLVVAFFLLGSARAQAQQADTANCDSVVAASRVDMVESGVFLSVHRIDGATLDDARITSLILNIGAAFIAPKPFKLSVFAGPVRSRALRTIARDTALELRAPTLTGIYRFASARRDSIVQVRVVRSSLLSGFDSAAVEAIRAVSLAREIVVPPDGDDSMRVDVRFATDSAAGAKRIVSARFPRMPVVDAVPLAGNPAAAYPDEAKADSVSGEVVLRFVVARDGMPDMSAIELVRGSVISFMRSALEVLPRQRFSPATIRGCAVAQTIDYPFTFVFPNSPPTH